MRNLSATTWLILAAVACAVGGAILVLKPPGKERPPPARWQRSAAAAQSELYVDERLCAECHPSQAADHARSGHADTFHLAGDHPLARQLAGRSFADPERSYHYEYRLDDRELSVAIPELFGQERFPLQYALGSGHNAVTFLSLVPSRQGDTVGIEHRVSLYAAEADVELDLTPGHSSQAPSQEVEHFGKRIRGDNLTRCVACHTTTGEIAGQEVVGLLAHVGCQSCHGPGREHVAAMETGGSGGYQGFTTQTAREEIELCGRCHRLPSNDPEVPAAADDIRNVRFQPVGLLESRCYTRSKDGLRCSDCHDPHQKVSRDLNHYVRKCLTCHDGPNAHACPVSPKTDCIRCHMPPVEIHRGIDFHDHWIRVRP